MNNNPDFKSIWQNRRPLVRPDIGEVIKKAAQLKKKERNKLVLVNSLLLINIIYVVIVSFTNHLETFTTRIGTVLILSAISAYLIISNKLFVSLFRSKTITDSVSYLAELIVLRKKQSFIQDRVRKLYVVLICAGLILFMIEPAKKMGFLWGSVAYVTLLGLITFLNFYIKPRYLKKQQVELDEAIKNLQIINDQFR